MERGLLYKFFRYAIYIIFPYCIIVIMRRMAMFYNWDIKFTSNDLFAIVPIILTMVLIDVTYSMSKQSNQLQKRQIKLQLFDKRYKVFQSVVDAKAMLMREDHFLNGFYDAKYFCNLGEKLTIISESLNESMVISQTLYDMGIYRKMREIVTQFVIVRTKFYELNLVGYKYSSHLSQEQIDKIRIAFICNTNNLTKMQEEITQLWPEFNDKLKPWADVVDAFNECIDHTHIFDDFDRYLKISTLDE